MASCCSRTSVDIKVVSFNMHGFYQGLTVVEDLINSESPDVLVLQEHWLTPDNLTKFDKHFTDYFWFGCSAMSNCLQTGMLRGRPFGGVITLVKKAFRSYTQSVHCDERFVVIRLANYVIVNVYLPCSGTNDRQLISSNILADIISWREQFANCKFIIAGDMNVNLDSCDTVAAEVNIFSQHCCLRRCDDIFPGSRRCTYVNVALNQQSCIDYILTSCSDDVTYFDVLDPDINYSDHLPLIVKIANIELDDIKQNSSLSEGSDSIQKYLRWDKADITGFYAYTGAQMYPTLQKIERVLLDYESQTLEDTDCRAYISQVYEEIVETLSAAAELYVPQRQKNFYKFWWSQELECLKQASVSSNRQWKAAGKPRHGPIFNDRQSCRMAYRKRIRDEQRNETLSYSNELHDALMLKDGSRFWKCWRSKFNNSGRCVEVDGCTESKIIVNNFKNYFQEIYTCNDSSQAEKLKSEYSKLKIDYCGLPVPCDLNFDTELVSNVLSKLKRGKAPDMIGLSAEHLIFSHPILSVILSRLFRLILLSGHVPLGFKISYIVPIPKQKDFLSKSLSYDDFRGIAISPIISKVFEYCFLDKFSSLLSSSENQFGFKKGSGCSNAVYTLRKIVDSYTTQCSTANICSIDLSKAFDKVNHHALFIKLIKRLFPVQLLDIIVALFSGCVSCVKWGTVYSSLFTITFGVRQGSVLSPILFSFYLNDLANTCAGINLTYIILYADDILLIAPSVTALENLLHICEVELQWLDMAINIKKSCCLRIGPRADAVCSHISSLSGLYLKWVNEIRYLGIFVVKSKHFKCSLDYAKRSFYRAANAIFGKIGRIASEEITLQLLYSKCVPVLLYGLEACPLNKSAIRSLDFVIDRFFMKLFKTNNINTVRLCQIQFGCQLPSAIIQKRTDTFLNKIYAESAY